MGRVLVALMLAAGTLVGAYWYKDRLKRNEKSKQALQTVNQEIEEKARLASLGDFNY
jgi:type II secretory pathway pseudopilin PulG